MDIACWRARAGPDFKAKSILWALQIRTTDPVSLFAFVKELKIMCLCWVNYYDFHAPGSRRKWTRGARKHLQRHT